MPPGRVIRVGDGEVVVALNGGTLKIGKMKREKGSKLAAGEFAKEVNLQTGVMFGR
jgi:hypothetical protein